MRKILYGLFLFCIIGVSQSFASTGVLNSTCSYNAGTDTYTCFNQLINYDTAYLSGHLDISYNFNLASTTTGQHNIFTYGCYGNVLCAYGGYPSSNYQITVTRPTGTAGTNLMRLNVFSSGSMIYQSDHTVGITTPTNYRIYWKDNVLRFYIGASMVVDTTISRNFEPPNPSASSAIVFRSQTSSGNTGYFRTIDVIQTSALECTTETIPDTQIINIQPTSTGAISEYVENPTDKEYGYSTSLSGENPLLVSLLNANNVSGWDEFSYQTGSVSFNSPLSGNTSLILSSSSNIEYIKLLGGYGKHTVITYQENSKTIKNIYDDVNLNDWAEGFGFPIGGSPLVVIQFGYSFFTKNINTLEVYSIGADDTKEVEICYNEDDDEYFVDGEAYTGNPYTDLVGEPEPTEVSFTSSGYLFYENGFCLSDFLPFPSGGDLLFDIKTPLGNILTTYPLKNTGLYKYGIGTCSKITTNYHEQAGQYYVKGRYIYKGVSYDIHPNFFAYKITKPESIPSDINPWLDDSPSACGVSDDEAGFLPGVSRFFACISETISMFFKNQYEAVKKIGSLIYEISDIFTTEVENPLAFLIPQASASEPLSGVMTVFDRPENFAETPFGKIEKLMWGAFAIVSLIVVLALIIMIKGD